jgi:UDP-N-acetylmuramoylalanine--D-glutamate ligase
MEVLGKKALVVGMAKSGISSARLLEKLGAQVFIYDTKKESEFKPEILKEIKSLHAVSFLGMNDDEITGKIFNFDFLVMSPGVPLNKPYLKKASELNKKVIGELELGYIYSKAQIVAITGTNGKTTTTALTGEIFKSAGFHTYVLGNIGIPVCDKALETKEDDYIVAEAAALQLDTTESFCPKACALLNITEDHLDRYGTMENYIYAKSLVFLHQTKDDYCILNYDNDIARSLAPKVPSRLLWFSRKNEVKEGAFVRDNDVIFKFNGLEKYICNIRQINIPGNHNLENALASVALASVMGISAQVIRRTLMDFKGVEHRIEFVREVDGVRYINDSKGTNPDATIKAIEAMKQPTILMLGGYDKHSEFVSLFQTMQDNIKAIVALGATAEKIMDAAKICGYLNIVKADSFRNAVFIAKELAKPGYNILLSPACASYDMFDNFEERGRVFKDIVNSL